MSLTIGASYIEGKTLAMFARIFFVSLMLTVVLQSPLPAVPPSTTLSTLGII